MINDEVLEFKELLLHDDVPFNEPVADKVDTDTILPVNIICAPTLLFIVISLFVP